MLGEVWEWAGRFRSKNLNLGIEHYLIGTQLAQALDDTKFWIDNNTYTPDEIAVRLHHSLVHTHPFPNGNGWHARLMADLLMLRLGQKRFTWGRNHLLTNMSDMRSQYIAALQAADDHDMLPLLEFAHS